MLRILADENMARLFAPNWETIRQKLATLGYHIEQLPGYLRGASDSEIADYIIRNGYDGVITEDTDFFQTHRSNLLWRLVNNGKVVLTVRRVNPTMSHGEVRIYVYEESSYGTVDKREILRQVIDY